MVDRLFCRILLAFGLVLLAACADGFDSGSEELTSATGKEKRIEWQGFVYVAPDADNFVIQKAIQRQIKSAIGALRKPEIGIQDRDALGNIDPATWVREELAVIDPAKPAAPATKVLRVRYRYKDVAIVRKTSTVTSLSVPLLFGDYVARAAQLIGPCSDDPKTAADSLWFHFTPSQTKCRTAMTTELAAVNKAATSVKLPLAISTVDANRNFLTVNADLKPVQEPPLSYPEYDRLWGFGSDRKLVVIYAFFGVDADLRKSGDLALIEHMRFLRTLRTKFPKLQVVETKPHVLLLDFDVGGKQWVASYDDVFAWMLDNKGYPAHVGASAALQEQLKQQVIDRFSERWIYWNLPVVVSRGSEKRAMTVQLRTYWGHEDGTAQARQAATHRYLEAFWHGDVFLYQGHSHFGHGPLEPTHYKAANFPNRYQVMLLNSCVSFNYYNADFLAMHPGGSKNLDIVVNGLPAFWTHLGQASAHYVIGLVDGNNRSWQDILASMVVKPAWAPAGYDPLRAVNGELDNTFHPQKSGPITVTVP